MNKNDAHVGKCEGILWFTTIQQGQDIFTPWRLEYVILQSQ